MKNQSVRILTMIKRLLLFAIVAYFLVISSFALAQETAESATPASTIDADKVQALKEKLATKVAELRENQTRGFYGEIASLSKTSFTLVTENQEVKVRYSEDALMFKLDGTKKAAKTADLKNSLSVAVLGLFDPEDSVITAKFILIQSHPVLISGEVTTIDKTASVVTLKTPGGKTVTFDYEKTTSSSEYRVADKKTVKSGLSRFYPGDRLYAWVLKTSEDDGAIKMSATRILRIPQAVLNPTAAEVSPSSAPSASPKVNPKSTPRASPSPTP